MTKTHHLKKQFKKKTARRITASIWFFSLSPVFLLAFLFLKQPENELPSIEMLEDPPEMLASVILADDGNKELGRYWHVNRTNIEYKDISPYIFDALISTEDERYLEHPGIDLRAVARAAINAGGAGGASTVSAPTESSANRHLGACPATGNIC